MACALCPAGEKLHSPAALSRFEAACAACVGSLWRDELGEAREKAGEWIKEIKKGRDPVREAEKEAQTAIEAERTRKANTFEAALQA